ncbi:MAG TPA: hypothetical protein VHM19_17310, partial [Polyangiales bacterium]|nr:hypothetical protein [Polyangiales bacterium]
MSRRARVLGVVGLMLTCAAVWYVVHRPAPLALAATIGGRLELAAGDVRVERDGHPEPTISGMPLPNHAAVRTGQGARALLRLLGGASAFLGDATSLKVEGSGVDLASGRIWLDVPALPEPAVHQIGELSVAVTSAGLSIERRADRIEVYVARGTAVVTAAKSRREVASGERAILEPGGQLRLEPVSFWDDWTGGMADRGMHGHDSSGSGTLYAVDRNGAPGVHAHSLSVKQQSVRARIA